MLHRTIILLFALFFFSACQKDSMTDITPAPQDGVEVDMRRSFPELLPLPTGFQPEGIVAGDGNDFYVGSLAGGSIYKGDFRTGAGEIIYMPDQFQVSVGLAFDQRTKYLFVSGGPVGNAFVLDTRTGEKVMDYSLGAGFINDVIVTQDAAYFTNSFVQEIYKVPLSPGGGLAGASAVETLPLGGDFPMASGGFDANGIEALPDGSALIVVNSTAGALYLVDPGTGNATTIDLNGGSVASGDGILLLGKTLYVVQNVLNQIAVVELSSDYLSGEMEEPLTDSDFQVPTTVTRHGGTLYAVNARFGATNPNDIGYDVVKVD